MFDPAYRINRFPCGAEGQIVITDRKDIADFQPLNQLNNLILDRKKSIFNGEITKPDFFFFSFF